MKEKIKLPDICHHLGATWVLSDVEVAVAVTMMAVDKVEGCHEGEGEPQRQRCCHSVMSQSWLVRSNKHRHGMLTKLIGNDDIHDCRTERKRVLLELTLRKVTQRWQQDVDSRDACYLFS